MTYHPVSAYWDKFVNEYYPAVCAHLMMYGNTASPRGLETKEFHPTSVLITNPRDRLVTSTGRMINLPFALAEVVQILMGQNDAQALRYYNSQIIKIQGDLIEGQTEDGIHRFNAAYGERMRHFILCPPDPEIGMDQLKHVIETLRHDPDSRQASIVLSHPYFDYYEAPTKDRACNVYAHAMIRDGKLDWMQIMRSNDIIWGLPYNFCQWLHVMDWVATALNVQMGNYYLVQDSLHVYQRHYEECAHVSYFNIYDYITEPLLKMHTNDKWFYENVVRWEEWIRTGGPTPLVSHVEPTGYWYAVVQVFNSYSAFKRKRDKLAFELMPTHPELRWPLMRNYCQWRWAKEEAEVSLHDLFTDCYGELRNADVDGEMAQAWLTR